MFGYDNVMLCLYVVTTTNACAFPPSYSVLLVKLLVLSILQDHWLSTRELLTELVGIVIQAITVIVVAVSKAVVALTIGWMANNGGDSRCLKDCLWQ